MARWRVWPSDGTLRQGAFAIVQTAIPKGIAVRDADQVGRNSRLEKRGAVAEPRSPGRLNEPAAGQVRRRGAGMAPSESDPSRESVAKIGRSADCSLLQRSPG